MNIANVRRNSLAFIPQSKLKQRHTQDFTPMLDSMQSNPYNNYEALESFDGAVIARETESFDALRAQAPLSQLSYAA